MIKYITIAISILIFGCTKDPVDEVKKTEIEIEGRKFSCFTLSASVNFNILNQNNEDMLNPATLGYFPKEKIKLFYLLNGEKIPAIQTEPNGGFLHITSSKPYIIRCFTPSTNNKNVTSNVNGVKKGFHNTLIEFNGNVTDTIRTEWESGLTDSCYYFIVRKVWYNGVPKELNGNPIIIQK